MMFIGVGVATASVVGICVFASHCLSSSHFLFGQPQAANRAAMVSIEMAFFIDKCFLVLECKDSDNLQIG